jgi:hypothetical protein
LPPELRLAAGDHLDPDARNTAAEVNMTMRTGFFVLSAVCFAFGLLAASGPALAQDDATPVLTPGVTGDFYVSPTWGYSLEWPDHWEVIASFSDQGEDGVTRGLSRGDYLLLSYGLPNGNSVSLEVMAGIGFDGSPATCLDTYVQQWEALEEQSTEEVAITGFRQATSDGQVIGGVDEFSAYGVFEYDLSGEEFHWQLVDYVDCRVLNDDGAILRIEASTLLEHYPTAVPVIQEVLGTLTMPDADPRNVIPLRALPPLDPAPAASPVASPDAAATPTS